MSDSANDRDKRPDRGSNDRQGGAPRRSGGGAGKGYSRDSSSGARDSAGRGDRPRYGAGRDDKPHSGDRARSGDRPAYGDKPRGDRPSYGDRPRSGAGRDDKPRGERPAYGDKPRGERPAYGDKPRGERPAYGDKPRGERPYGDKPRGERPAYGDRPRSGAGRDDKPRGERPAYGDKPRGERPYGDKPRGERPSYGDRVRSERPRTDRPHSDRPRTERPARGGDKLWTRAGAPARGDRNAFREEEEVTEEQRMQRELRMVRAQHDDPDIPVSVTANDLDRVARNELKTLTTDNAERVARHLAMAAMLIDEDPALAHQHALSAARRAGRIGVVRETLAITAYETGDYALALRELRTHRRITGSNDQLPLMVDSERGVGRPERALELGRTVDRATLAPAVRVALSIAMSGARLDLGQPELALAELQIPELSPERAFDWSPELFGAEAEVLEELGRADEAALWRKRSEVAAAALSERSGEQESETVEVFEILEIDDDDDDDDDEDAVETDAADVDGALAAVTDDEAPEVDTTPADEEPLDDAVSEQEK